MKHRDLAVFAVPATCWSAPSMSAAWSCRHEIQGRFPTTRPNASLVGGTACGVLAIAALVLEPREDSPQ